MSTDRAEGASRSAIEWAIGMWRDYLRAALSRGMSEPDVAELMAPASRDKAWIYHGSTGGRSRLYALDDYLQARFDFDRDEVLVSYAIFAATTCWLKAPDGILLHGFDDGTAELQFPE